MALSWFFVEGWLSPLITQARELLPRNSRSTSFSKTSYLDFKMVSGGESTMTLGQVFQGLIGTFAPRRMQSDATGFVWWPV